MARGWHEGGTRVVHDTGGTRVARRVSRGCHEGVTMEVHGTRGTRVARRVARGHRLILDI